MDSVRFDRLNRRRFESGDRENLDDYMETTLQVKQIRNTYFQWATKGKASSREYSDETNKSVFTQAETYRIVRRYWSFLFNE